MIHVSDAEALSANLGLVSAGDCLLQLLDSLPLPVIVPKLYEAAISAGSSMKHEAAFRVAASLPPVHTAVLTHCMAFLKALVDRRHEGKDALLGRLGVIWAQVLMRPPPERSIADAIPMKQFVELFLRDT